MKQPRLVPSFDHYHLMQLDGVAKKSKDPDTQVGAIIVDEDNHQIMTGYNGFPPGVAETAERWQSGTKHEWVIHAEANAIAHAAKKGVSLKNSTLFVHFLPCHQRGCDLFVVASGIKRVVCFEPLANGSTFNWKDESKITTKLFDEVGIQYCFYDKKLNLKYTSQHLW